jgi:hypothetical protein
MRASLIAGRLPMSGAVLLGLLSSACVPAPQPTGPFTLGFDAEQSGTLRSGEVHTLQLPVEAEIRYAIALTGSAGTIGIPDLRLSIPSGTIPEGLRLDVRGVSLLRPEAVRGFQAAADGLLPFTIENRTEGLTLDQGLARIFLGDATRAQYRIRAYRLGPDDHGAGPEEATRLVDDGEFVRGTMEYGDDYDFFVVAVEEGRQYRISFEASGEAKVATSSIDQFDEFNFGAAAAGGVQFRVDARSGSPAERRFTAIQDDDLLLGVAPGPENLLAGIFGVPRGFGAFPVRYAIAITSASGGRLQSGGSIHDIVTDAGPVDYFIDIPPGTQRVITQVTGPDWLAVFLNPSEPASDSAYLDFLSPVVSGESTMITEVAAGVSRYYLSVSTLTTDAADYTLEVTLE